MSELWNVNNLKVKYFSEMLPDRSVFLALCLNVQLSSICIFIFGYCAINYIVGSEYSILH